MSEHPAPRNAFLFDMDGVLVDSEQVWHSEAAQFAEDLYGAEVYRRMGETMGLSVDAEYDLATSLGFRMDREEFRLIVDGFAEVVYGKAPITAGADTAIDRLIALGYVIGLVTGSPRAWVERVLARFPGRERFAYILSVGDRRELQSKPHPDGYVTAMHEMGVAPERTLVLEDSNNGIRAAKASGATVIGYRGNLLDGYVQEGADFYAETMADVVKIAEDFAPGNDGIPAQTRA